MYGQALQECLWSLAIAADNSFILTWKADAHSWPCTCQPATSRAILFYAVAVIKHSEQKLFRAQKGLFQLPGHSLSWMEIRTGTRSRNYRGLLFAGSLIGFF